MHFTVWHQIASKYFGLEAICKKIVFDRGSKGINRYLHGEGDIERDISATLCYSKTAMHNAILKFSTGGTFCNAHAQKLDCIMHEN